MLWANVSQRIQDVDLYLVLLKPPQESLRWLFKQRRNQIRVWAKSAKSSVQSIGTQKCLITLPGKMFKNSFQFVGWKSDCLRRVKAITWLGLMLKRRFYLQTKTGSTMLINVISNKRMAVHWPKIWFKNFYMLQTRICTLMHLYTTNASGQKMPLHSNSILQSGLINLGTIF